LRASDGRVISVSTARAGKYSVEAALPKTLTPGDYAVWVHNGFGGASAWGTGATLRVAVGTPWPTEVVNVRDQGARGDDVADDSEAFRRALEAAERRGGGVVYCPAGT